MTDENHTTYGRRSFLKAIGAATVLTGFAGQGSGSTGAERLIVGVEEDATIDDVRAAVSEDPDIPSQARITHHNPAIDYAVIEIPGPAPQAAERAEEAVGAKSSVRYAETDYEITTAEEEIQAVEPNDPRWGEEWAERAINVPTAWETTQASLDTILAILDTGLDVEHPDLRDRVTDDWGGPDPRPSGSDDHGTHCGGCAAATTGNGVGVAGPANSRLLGYNVFDNVRAEDAIVDATDKGTDVISLSWSVGYEQQQSLHDAIQYATDRGTVVLAASANDGRTDSVTYPASDANVIAVGATDQNGNVADFSNSGPNLDLVAPGVSVLSTLPQESYGRASGTSMACPVTAGVVALAKDLDPSLTTEEVRGLITDTATTLEGVPSDRQAAGQVDAAAVVDALSDDGGSGGAAIPGRIEAEDYDAGGEGVAYHDTTAGNSGGAYRSDDVDIEVCSEGGYNVGWMESGEWLTYTVDIASAGTYQVDARVASAGGGGAFNVEQDQDVRGSIDVPDTGDWQAWTTVSTQVDLDAGQHTLAVYVDSGGFNLNWLEFSEASGLVDGATYRVRNVNSGMALEVESGSTSNGANVQQWSAANVAHHEWTLEAVGDGTYRLLNANSGKALDVDGVSTDPGANVHQWDYVGGENQHWRIEANGDGTYRIIADHSGLALDVADWSTADGANVLQWDYTGGANQHWTFERR